MSRDSLYTSVKAKMAQHRLSSHIVRLALKFFVFEISIQSGAIMQSNVELDIKALRSQSLL